ncbi:terpene cyclase/mutase family protein [Streptomyces sp. A3M-1-3]|uniref:prenyltransferase/squalene oxidase repeat-containing protein n=1 Tax=Streptomyces sp. A3M-1-3 TaxID=2962044 RepID=UPI0020B7BD38|nr:prenyltransferase/squalene oxidase repeat-containing protein [Streptomyces sp. A3M-1-3]MCP3816624.1 terpene cyclase/mutase family protein [Streptomyces sp. A3M-1-3]
MTVRRSAAALAASAVLCVAAAPTAVAAPSPTPSPVIPSGLYGKKDPTYDGVWRQSLAMLAQDTVGVTPAKKAVDWLVGQQCATGGFAAFRADAAKPCDAKTMVDSNSTAVAVQSLAALGGHADAVKKSVGWLKSVQNEDGGWGYMPGGPSDANSTSVVIGALAAAGEKPAEVKSKKDKSAYDGLLAFTIPCGKETNGGFAFQPDKSGKLTVNADASAAGALGGLGKGLVATPGSKDGKATTCEKRDESELPAPELAAHNASQYLASELWHSGYLKSAMPGAEDQPDVGNTADAVVAVAVDGRPENAMKAVNWLKKNSAAWAKEGGPAAYAQLILAAHATGTDPRAFGGADLIQQLNATGPAPEAAAKPAGKKDEKKDDDSGVSVWWIVGVGAVAGIGIGFLISGRKKNQQL